MLGRDLMRRMSRDQSQGLIKIGRVSRIDRSTWPYICDVVVNELEHSYELTGCVATLPFQEGNSLGVGVWPNPVPLLDNGQIVVVLCINPQQDGVKYIIGQIPNYAFGPSGVRQVDIAVPDLENIIDGADGRKYLKVVQLQGSAGSDCRAESQRRGPDDAAHVGDPAVRRS